MVFSWWAYYQSKKKFGDYQPQFVTFYSLKEWIGQFDKDCRVDILRLLMHVEYYSERRIRHELRHLNETLLRRLDGSNIPPKKVVYIQTHDAGSSSPVMLNFIRNDHRLETIGCKFFDSNDIIGINRATNSLAEGAIVYIDDFAGSGDQFEGVHKMVSENVIGNFSQYLLVPVICEEAHLRFSRWGVEPVTNNIHMRSKRPLHEASIIFSPEQKTKLINICQEINPKNALGYERLASMVVIYHNAPNSIPAIFRGSNRQNPYKGIFPRTTDLLAPNFRASPK